MNHKKHSKFAATRCQNLRLKRTKFDFPTPLRELTALRRRLAGKGNGPHGGEGIGWSEIKRKGRAGNGMGGW